MKKILILEDDQTHLLISKIWLKLIIPSAEIIEKRDGQEAIDYLSTNGQIDLLLVDIKLPKMDGFQFMEKYRQGGGQAPAIAVTAIVYGHPISAWENFQGVIFKPFDKEKLQKEIERLL